MRRLAGSYTKGEVQPTPAANLLRLLLEGGQEEAKARRRWLERNIPGEVWRWIQNRQDATRPLTAFEAERVRDYYSISSNSGARNSLCVENQFHGRYV